MPKLNSSNMRTRHHQQQRQKLNSSPLFPFVFGTGVLFVLLNVSVISQWQVVDRMLHVEQFQLRALRNNFLAGSTMVHSHIGSSSSSSSSSSAQPIYTTRRTQLDHQQQRQLQQQQQQQAREQFGGAASNAGEDSGEVYAVNAFHFGFFDDSKLQRNGWVPPTQEEYQGLLCQTKAFYLNLFQNKLGDNIYVNLYTQNWTYSRDTMFPVSHSLVVHATFEDGTPLDPKDINRCIQASDMASYVERFVWKSEPFQESVFYDTNQSYSETSLQTTKFAPNSDINADIDTQQPSGGIVIGSSLSCTTNGNYEVSLHFGYFPGFGRKPSIQEIENLKPLTEAYLSRVLQFSYATRQVQVSLNLQGWDFDEATTDKDNMPLTIRYYLTASFVYGGDVIPMEYVKEKLARDDNVKDTIMRQYIKQAVWEVPPFKQSSFWDVNRARMHNKIYKVQRGLNKHGDGDGDIGGLGGTDNGNGALNGGDGNGQGGVGGNGGNSSDSGLGSQPGDGGVGILGGGIPGIGGFGANAPGIGGDPGRAGALTFGSGENGDDNANRTSNDPTRTKLFSLVLQPVTVSPDECRDLLKDANTNLDRFLNTTEFLVFLNSITNQTYFGFPYVALPDAVQDTFMSLSTKTDDNHDAINLLGAYNPAISREDLNLLEKTREDKICRYVKSNLNEAIKKGAVTSYVLVSNVEFFVRHEGDEFGSDPNTTVLDLAFSNVVAEHISPGMEKYMEEGTRRLQERHFVTESERTLQKLRRLQEDTSCYVLPSSAAVNLEEANCRGATKEYTKCFNAVGSFNTFFKGEKASEMAPKMEPRADELAEEAIANGDLGNEVADMDPLWTVETMFAPTAMPSVAPSLSPSVAPPPTVSPTSGHKDKSFGETLTDNGGTGIATAAVGSVVLMVALQCGREFLVDLVIRCCKACCIKYRKSGDNDSDFDSQSDSEEGEYDEKSYGDGSYEDSQYDEDNNGSSHHNSAEATETDGEDGDLGESDEEEDEDEGNDKEEDEEDGGGGGGGDDDDDDNYTDSDSDSNSDSHGSQGADNGDFQDDILNDDNQSNSGDMEEVMPGEEGDMSESPGDNEGEADEGPTTGDKEPGNGTRAGATEAQHEQKGDQGDAQSAAEDPSEKKSAFEAEETEGKGIDNGQADRQADRQAARGGSTEANSSQISSGLEAEKSRNDEGNEV